MFGDILVITTGEEVPLVEAKEAAEYFTIHTTAPPKTKNCPAQNVSRAEVENPSPRKSCKSVFHS